MDACSHGGKCIGNIQRRSQTESSLLGLFSAGRSCDFHGRRLSLRAARRSPLAASRSDVGNGTLGGDSLTIQMCKETDFQWPEWLEDMEKDNVRIEEAVGEHHTHATASNECCSVLLQEVRAPIDTVWSIVRKFDQPQTYKRFVRSCFTQGDVRVGSTREVTVISGLPATTSTEQLDILDDEKHIMSFKVLGGDHRLKNYRSITTLHEALIEDSPGTIVMESYIVEVPEGNTPEDTRMFTDTVIKCNLQSLARTCERHALHAGA